MDDMIRCPFPHDSVGKPLDGIAHPKDFPCKGNKPDEVIKHPTELLTVSVEDCLSWCARKAAAAYKSPVKEQAYASRD